ncbi:MAG: hypothetical protein PSX36_09570 [bacterium]|nr:hypothetical protein [bacterium]
MKKLIALTAILGVTAFLSCKKAEKDTVQTTNETVNVVLDANKSYTYDLGKVSANDVLIASQATHAAQSKVAIVPGATTNSYQYTPQDNYSGTDQVILHVKAPHKQESSSTCGNQQSNKGGKCGGHSGKCGKHHDDQDAQEVTKVITFNITVNSAGTAK